MGSKSERLVHPISDRLVNPTVGGSAYNLFSIMTKEKSIVENNPKEVVTTQFDASTYHTQRFHKIINEFFQMADSSNYLEISNELVHCFLEVGMRKKEGLKKERIKNVVYMAMFQSQFIVALQEQWGNFKKFNDVEI